MEKGTWTPGKVRFSVIVAVFAVVCMILGTGHPVAAAGYWKLRDIKMINRTPNDPLVKVRRHTNTYVEFQVQHPGGGPEVLRAAWAPPTEVLIPDGNVLTEIKVSIVSCPPHLNHDTGLDAGCGFEHFDIEPGCSSGSGIGGAGTRHWGRAPGSHYDKKIIKAPKREFGDAEGRMQFRVMAGVFCTAFIYQWIGGEPPKTGTGKTGLDPEPDTGSDENTNNTAWIVGHPVPWVFHPDGTIDAKGLWSGTWVRSGDDYTVTITHMGVQDTFIVRFSPDRRSFTAYKNGQVYRQGVRR